MRYICTSIVAIALLGITGTSLGQSWQAIQEMNGNASNDNFGWSVDIDGDTCVIGASTANNYNGSAYIYTRDGCGTWSQVFQAEGSGSHYRFGEDVAIDGDTCVIIGGGSAYIYENSNASGNWSWSLATQLNSTSATSVDIDGDTCVIGAMYANGYDGSAYIYENSNASGNWSWSLATQLNSTSSNDFFGSSVAIDGDTCVIGACGANNYTGSAYIYENSNASGNWSQVAKLDGDSAGSEFGYSIDIDGNNFVVGAPYDSSYYYYGGSAYYCTSNGNGSWSKTLIWDGVDYYANSGESVAIDGNTCVIGNVCDNDCRGSVDFLTLEENGNWQWVGTRNGNASGDFLGLSVAIDGGICLAGAPGTDINGSRSGSVYIYGEPPATGSCCVSSGCFASTCSDCSAVGGTYIGGLITCADVVCVPPSITGACCVSSVCFDATGTQCTSIGGTYAGDEIACADAGCPTAPGTGACCVSSVCFNATGTQCTSIGGTYAGDDIACADAGCPTAPATGACCVGSSCFDATNTQCTDADGNWIGAWNGLCDDCPITCEGDTNGNGTVDIEDLLITIGAWGPCV